MMSFFEPIFRKENLAMGINTALEIALITLQLLFGALSLVLWKARG